MRKKQIFARICFTVPYGHFGFNGAVHFCEAVLTFVYVRDVPSVYTAPVLYGEMDVLNYRMAC